MKSLRKKVFLCACVGCLAVLFAPPKAQAARPAATFIKNASISNQFEIESSRMALQLSQDNNVKQFAQQMVDDHTEAGNNLREVVSSSRAPLEQPAANLDSRHRRMLNRLNRLSGDRFDREYIQMQVSAHDEAVSLFRDYANTGRNPDLREFAAQTLPTLEHHRREVRRLSRIN